MARGTYCNVEGHLSSDLYGQQLSQRQREIHRLQAENAALMAQLGQAHSRDTPEGDVLIALAEAIHIGLTFGEPAADSVPSDDVGARGKPRSAEPRGGDRAARSALRELIRGVESRIERFHNRRENDFRRVEIDFEPAAPRRRCWTRSCDDYSRTVDEDHRCHTADVANTA